MFVYNSSVTMEEAVNNGEVVVVWSGGLDSTGLIFLLLDKYNCKVHPLFVRRGQSNLKYENQSVNYYSRLFSKKYKELFCRPIKVSVKVPANEFREFSKEAQYAIRNSDIINQGVRLAIQLGINMVLVATFKPEDQFNDGSPKYLKSKTKEVRIGTGKTDFLIVSPFFYKPFPKKKSNLIRICYERGLDLNKTRSCYRDTPQDCGSQHCSACGGRKKAFHEARIIGKTNYS